MPDEVDGQEPFYNRRQGPVHGYFEMSRAGWLVLPRVVLQEMPIAWQDSFVRLLRRMEERFDWLPDDVHRFQITGRDARGKFVPLPRGLDAYRHPDSDFIQSIQRGDYGEGSQRRAEGPVPEVRGQED